VVPCRLRIVLHFLSDNARLKCDRSPRRQSPSDRRAPGFGNQVGPVVSDLPERVVVGAVQRTFADEAPAACQQVVRLFEEDPRLLGAAVQNGVRSVTPATPALVESAVIRLTVEGLSEGWPDDGDEVGPFDLPSDDGHGDTPSDAEQQAEGDITEPVHSEHETSIDDEQRSDECDQPGPPDPVGQRNGAEQGEENCSDGDGVAGGKRVAGLVHASDGARRGVVGGWGPVSEDDLANGEDLELSAEVGDDGDEGPSGAQSNGQDGAEHHADDGQGSGVEVGGDILRDTDERAAVCGEPAFDGVVPALDRAPTMSTDDQKSHDDPDHEDPDGDCDQYFGGPDGSPGLADRVRRAPSEVLSLGHDLCEEAPGAESKRISEGRRGE